MFKFIKQYAETMDGATIFPMISLFIFLGFFVALLIWVKKLRKEEVKELANIPFEKEELSTN